MSNNHNKLTAIIMGTILVTAIFSGILLIQHKTKTDMIAQRKP